MPKVDYRPKDYWTFEPLLRSFKATGYGEIKEIDGLSWRVRGGDFVLLTPPGGKVLTIPQEANRARIRSLVWTYSLGETISRKASGWTYAAPPGWEPGEESARLLRRGEKENLVAGAVSKVELRDILETWIEDKKEHKPTAMVVRGHYAAMIDDPDIVFVGWRKGAELLGAFGYTIDPVTKQAAIGFAKHSYGSWWLSRFLWIKTIRIILSGGARGVVCGDTADRLKRELGLLPFQQYRVDFSNV